MYVYPCSSDWLFHTPAVTAPIIGQRTLEHLESSLSALGLKLDDDVTSHIGPIWPGPGGPGSEAYAW